VNEALSEAELVRLRRIRRLTELGINLAGIEVILDMRCRIEELQKQVVQLESKAGSSPDQGLEHDRVQLLEWSV
jgi:DNA-binding transcriptional MerR regulator